MTFPEYLYRMRAHALKRVDKEYDMHLQAWLNREITLTKQEGSKEVYVYKNLRDFYDYEKELNEVKGNVEGNKPENNLNEQQKRMARIAARLNR